MEHDTALETKTNTNNVTTDVIPIFFISPINTLLLFSFYHIPFAL